MKTTLVVPAILLLCLTLNQCAPAQKASQSLFPPQYGLTSADAAAGIKEALVKGTSEGVDLVSKVDGFLGNPEIKIPFPPDAAAIEEKFRAMGLGKQVDQVIVSMNRAAEDAARDAQPIFIDAIKKMTITDAVSIVQGDSDAATLYLKKNTSGDLNLKFQPSIKASLEKVNATKYWQDVISIYNQLPLVEKINPNLTEYVTGKAIDGLFVMIAREESAIRRDPLARTTDILRKVFGQK